MTTAGIGPNKWNRAWEWYTPPAIIRAARRTMGGIDLDPASTAEANEVVRAAKYWTAEDDGLFHVWPSEARVWCNPPWGARQLAEWIPRALSHDAPTLLLVPASNSKAHDSLLASEWPICWMRDPSGWWGPDATTENGRIPLQVAYVVVVGMRVDREAFVGEFSPFGVIR